MHTTADELRNLAATPHGDSSSARSCSNIAFRSGVSNSTAWNPSSRRGDWKGVAGLQRSGSTMRGELSPQTSWNVFSLCSTYSSNGPPVWPRMLGSWSLGGTAGGLVVLALLRRCRSHSAKATMPATSSASAADPTAMPAAAEMLTLPPLLPCVTDCVTGDCMVDACLVGAGMTKVVECPLPNDGDADLTFPN